MRTMAEKNRQDQKLAKTRGQRLFVLFWVLLIEAGAFALFVILTGKFLGIGWALLGLLSWGLLTYFLVYLVLAHPDNNASFLRVPEGYAVVLSHMGVIRKAVIRWMGHDIDKEGEVKDIGEGEKPRDLARRIFGGLIYVGFYPFDDVKIIEEAKGAETFLIDLRDRFLNIQVKGAEDAEGLKLTMEAKVRFRITNPIKLLKEIEKPWMEHIGELLEAEVRDALTQGAFLTIIKDKKAIGKRVITIMAEEDSVDTWKKKYGLQIFSIRVININVENKELYETLLKQWKADKDGAALTTLASAEAQAFTIKAEAVDAQGSVGRLLVITEALKDSPLGAAVTVQAIPGLGIPGLAGGAFESERSQELAVHARQLSAEITGLINSLKGEEKKGGD